MTRIGLFSLFAFYFLFAGGSCFAQASKIIGTLAEDHFTKYTPIPGGKYVGSGWIKRNDSIFAALMLVKSKFEPEKVWASNMNLASTSGLSFKGILPVAFPSGFLAYGEGRNNESILSRFDYQLNLVWQKSLVSANDGFHHVRSVQPNLFFATSLSDLTVGKSEFFLFDSSGVSNSRFYYRTSQNGDLVLQNMVTDRDAGFGFGRIAGLRDSTLLVKMVDSTIVKAQKIAIIGLPNLTLKLGARYRDSLYFYGTALPAAGSAGAEIIVKTDTNLNISWAKGRNIQTTTIRSLYPSPDGKLYAISARFDPPNLMLSKITPNGDMIDRRAGGRSGFSLVLDGEIVGESGDSLISTFTCRYQNANRRNTLVHYCQKSGISDCNTVASTLTTNDYSYVLTKTQFEKVRLTVVQTDQTPVLSNFGTEQNINTCLPTEVETLKSAMKGLVISPNPIESGFRVENPDHKFVEITWIDAQGKNLGTYSLHNGMNELRKPEQASGLVYLIFKGPSEVKAVKALCR